MATQAKEPSRDQRLHVLKWRSRALDWAAVLAALAGTLTCAAVLVLLGEMRGTSGANLLFLVFDGAIVLTMGALAAFVIEMLLAARGVRLTVEHNAGPSF